MFPSYDLAHQVRAMRFAAEHGLPVPLIIGEALDPTLLGRPFFVMERVDGRVPADDDPPFTKAGFLFDASPASQRRFHDSAVDSIAAVHAVGELDLPGVASQPVDHLRASRTLEEWCRFSPPVLDHVHGLLDRSVPVADTARCGLVWGDARPANMVVDDEYRVVAQLDWELAASGPGELDVAWFCEMNRMRSAGMGIAPLPGFPDEEETWDRWEQAVGRRAEHLDWYRLFSAYRVAVFMQLYLAAMVDRGHLPAGHRLLDENPGTRRLNELLGR